MKGLTKIRGWQSDDLESVKQFVNSRQGYPYIDNLDETFGIQSIRDSMTIWRDPAGKICSLFFVDDYQNFWFDQTDSEDLSAFLDESIPLALEQAVNRFEQSGLDLCEHADSPRLQILQAAGFKEIDQRTYKYHLNTKDWINQTPVPSGYRVRSVRGKEEVPALVVLHCAAFGTAQMDEEYRLAMMNISGYDKHLDLLLEADDGSLVAFCMCSAMEVQNERIGFTDPVGVVPALQGRGLGKVIISAGVELLKQRGLEIVELGTSSKNKSMQKLAESVGFQKTEEKIWFHLEG